MQAFDRIGIQVEFKNLVIDVGQRLHITSGFGVLPHLVPVNRGIHSSILVTPKPGKESAAAALEALHAAYDGEPFVRVLAPGKLAETKHITLTNMCEIGCVYDERTNRLIVSSAIDGIRCAYCAGMAIL